MSLPQLSKPVAMVLSLGIVLLVGYLEWATGPRVAFSVFYLLPVVVGTWYAGGFFGLCLAAIATICRIAIHATGTNFQATSWIGRLERAYRPLWVGHRGCATFQGEIDE